MRLICVLLAFTAYTSSAVVLTACGASAEMRTRTALETLAQVVDPAYEAAMAGCTAQEAVVMERARAGALSPGEARAQLDAIMGPCLQVSAAFERIRKLHDQAAILVETGQLAQAEQALGELRKAWALLGGVNP
jgi:hypothetical protein